MTGVRTSRSFVSRRGYALALLVATAACGEAVTESPVGRAFDRPVDVAFGCWGKLRIGDAVAPVAIDADRRRRPAHAMLAPVLADDAEPALVEKLEQAGGAGGARANIRIEPAF